MSVNYSVYSVLSISWLCPFPSLCHFMKSKVSPPSMALLIKSTTCLPRLAQVIDYITIKYIWLNMKCISSYLLHQGIKVFFFFVAECSFSQETLTTFNNRRYKNEMPLSCYQVLAQDCTDELKFIVLLKKDHIEQNHINVKIADMWVSIINKNETVVFTHKLTKQTFFISALVVILTCTRGTLTWLWRSMEWKYLSTTFHTSIPQVPIHIHPTIKILHFSSSWFQHPKVVKLFTCHVFKLAWSKWSWPCFVLIAKIQIRPNGEGISVYAPSLGLHEVYFDKNSWKVTVILNMDNALNI